MAIFNISPLNSLQFIRKDDLQSSFRNTAYQDVTSLARKPYCQMVVRGDTITIQVKTDYTSVTAVLYNVLTNTETALTETLTGDYTAFDFWEIPITFSTNGFYKIFVTGLRSGYAPARWESEMIEVRTSWDGLKIEYYNSENTAYVDYSNDLIHMVRVDGILRFSDVGGKDEFYNNLGVEERVYSEEETIYDLAVEDIPYYLGRQLVYASKCDTFIVNDVEYIVKNHSLSPRPNSHNFDLTMQLTQKEVIGVNADDTDHDYTWDDSESGDSIVAANEVITVYDDYITVVADLTHSGSGVGDPLTGAVTLYEDGSTQAVVQIAWNNGGTIGTKTLNAKIYPGHTYYLSYDF